MLEKVKDGFPFDIDISVMPCVPLPKLPMSGLP